ncbi:GNAT family N-acetyltransferase [Pseudoroseicyclus tamaricis]|uniref:GNAT family N-acetyltransferase n=1 Tax=Pseudoroseicyclus tamaricis TaxID=2705421 RepID=A0A6B2K2A1_9RHOB|nr:GNAT family N-acetyltransferase [Pseudoroseicyclus tamaricis]NDV02664.1 GNAT family N-acetyltransferase [Pseudoroseicyclus tamaricis]
MIRPATPADAPALARLHVLAWGETYRGLLPEEEILARPFGRRLEQWRREAAAGTSRIAYAPGLGFAQAGPQRDGALAATGWPEELYGLYLLKAGQGRGLGRRLLHAVAAEGPMTALVLEENHPACVFYARTGARCLEVRAEHIGRAEIREAVYGWTTPPR